MHFLDKLKTADILMLLIASLLLLFQAIILTGKVPPTAVLGGEEEEEFPALYKRHALLDCDQVIQRTIDRGGTQKWSPSVVLIGMSHGIGSSITACQEEARLRR